MNGDANGLISDSRHGFDVLRLDQQINRNALSLGLLAGLTAGVRRSAEQCSRGLVIEHSGPVFCSGVDLKERRGLPVTDPSHTDALAELLRLLWDHPRPIVAVVDGAVRGGGLGLLACADVVVASPRSTFAYSEVRVGVAPALVIAATLAHTPPRLLLPHALTGLPFDATTAHELGLVTTLADDAVATADHLLVELGAAAPGAQMVVKELVRRTVGADVGDALAQTAMLSTALFSRPEAAEGMAAFAERRQPAWVPA